MARIYPTTWPHLLKWRQKWSGAIWSADPLSTINPRNLLTTLRHLPARFRFFAAIRTISGSSTRCSPQHMGTTSFIPTELTLNLTSNCPAGNSGGLDGFRNGPRFCSCNLLARVASQPLRLRLPGPLAIVEARAGFETFSVDQPSASFVHPHHRAIAWFDATLQPVQTDHHAQANESFTPAGNSQLPPLLSLLGPESRAKPSSNPSGRTIPPISPLQSNGSTNRPFPNP